MKNVASGVQALSRSRGVQLAGYSTDPGNLAEADVINVAVSTPVDAAQNPNLGPLISLMKFSQ